MKNLLIAAIALVAAGSVQAQSAYPSRPISMVVGFAPGGGTDAVARILAKSLSESLGQQVVVENKAGAGGNIATDHVAHAAPDGHTILLGSVGSLAVAPHVISNLGYAPLRDFTPISMAVVFSNVLVVQASLPAQTLGDFVKLAKDKPGTVTYGSSGILGAGHLAGELLKIRANIDIVHVPYRGGAAAAMAVVGGQVQMMIDVMPNAFPLVKGGKVRGLAVSTAHRHPAAPEVPTIAESGLPGYDVSAWDGIFAPAGTPAAIVDRLNAAIRQALDDPQVRAALLARGAQAVPSTPEGLARHVAAEAEKWAKVVRQSGAKID